MGEPNNDSRNDKIVDVLKDLLITSLGTAGVKQTEIRRIAGCDMNRIVRHIERGN